MEFEELVENNRKAMRMFDLLLKAPEISVGMTPSEVVYTQDDMRLLHYTPVVKSPYPVPVLIVYALVNRYYILDLQPD
jgi:polyhydroxyalkanoate synthase